MKKLVIFFFMMCSSVQLMAQFTWAPVVTLSASIMDNSSDPQVVTDPNGNATAAWIENGLVYASFLPVNGTWNTPVILSGAGASSPVLGCDGNGNVTAVWVEANGTVTVSTLPLNGVWSAAQAVSAAGASSPSLAVEGTGNIAIVWQRSGYIEASTQLFGAPLSLVSTISPVNSSNPNVAIGANGTVVAVWQTILASGEATVESASQSSIGGVWGAAVNILPTASAFSMNYPVVSVDVNGNADVIWYRYLVINGVYSNVFVYSASLPVTSSSWSLPIQISDTGIGNPADLFIRINTDGAGHKIAIWSISHDGQSYVVESSDKVQGGAWTPVQILQNQNQYAFEGGLSTDLLGYSVAANMFFNGTTVDIQAAEASASQVAGGVFWTSVATLSVPGSNNGFPLISSNYNAIGPTEYATAVWVSASGSNTIIQAANGVKTPGAPPTNLAVTQNVLQFGVFNDYYNTLTWNASSDPTVVEYVVYRNGLLVAQVSLDTFEYVDHNAIQNGPVTYGVAALNNQSVLSQVVNINFP